ncbi:MAG: hypothetical protein ACQESP_00825 [Candidatus Muiribacteriota bacterium]
MKKFIYGDLSFLPYKNKSLIDNVFEILKNENKKVNNIKLYALRELIKLYYQGYKEFSFYINESQIVSVYPKNQLHKQFALWTVFNNDNIEMFLFDKNAKLIVSTKKSSYSIGLKDKSEFKNEPLFFRKELNTFLEKRIEDLLKGSNIKKEHIIEFIPSGNVMFIYLIYYLFPPESDDFIVEHLPVMRLDELGFDFLKECPVFTFSMQNNYNNLFDFLIKVLKNNIENDFIFIYGDIVAGYSRKDNQYFYVSAVFEEKLQRKIIDYLRNTKLNLPVEVIVFDKNCLNIGIKEYYLSDKIFSDNIIKNNLDIGEIGFW